MIRVLQKIGDSKIQRYPIKNLLTSNSISSNIAIADISHPQKKNWKLQENVENFLQEF